MDGAYGAYVDEECFDIQDCKEDTDDDTDGDTDDDADDGGRGNLYTFNDHGSRLKARGSRFKAQGPRSRIKDLVWP